MSHTHHCIHINASHHTIVNSSCCIRELRLLSFFVFVTIKFCWKGNTIFPVFVLFRFPLHLGVVNGASKNYNFEIFCSCTSFCICTSLLKLVKLSTSGDCLFLIHSASVKLSTSGDCLFLIHLMFLLHVNTPNHVWMSHVTRGGGLGSSTIFKKFNETYAPS